MGVIATTLVVAGLEAPREARAQTSPSTSPTTPAVSEEADRRARSHFASGRAYYDTGEYEAAVREFLAARAASPRNELRYNLYLCYERLGDFAHAAEELELFLQGSPPDLARRDVFELRLQNLRRRMADASATAETPRDERLMSIDGAGPATTNDVPASATSATATATTTTATTATATTAEEGTAAGATATPPASPARGRDDTLTWVGVSIAAVGLVTVGIAGAVTLSENDRLASCRPGCSAESTSTIAVSAPLTDVGFGVALAGAVLGTIGVLTAEPSPDDGPQLSLGPTGGSFRLTF